MTATIDELLVADEPDAWRALGFAVEGDVCDLVGARIRLLGRDRGRGLFGWALRDAEPGEHDGLVTTISTRPPSQAPEHPNGVDAVDHVVAITPELERTVAALVGAGLDLRRIREEPTPAGAPRQAFFRLGPTLLEVVQEPDSVVAERGVERPAFFWGLALRAADVEVTAASIGEAAGEVRPAAQPGRMIATLGRAAGLAVPVALISPPPARSSSSAP